MPGVEAQVVAGCITTSVILLFVCFEHILNYFFLLITYNLLWQEKQEKE